MTGIILRTKCTTKGTNTYYKRVDKAFDDWMNNCLEESFFTMDTPKIIFYVPNYIVAKEVQREVNQHSEGVRECVEVIVDKKEAMK